MCEFTQSIFVWTPLPSIPPSPAHHKYKLKKTENYFQTKTTNLLFIPAPLTLRFLLYEKNALQCRVKSNKFLYYNINIYPKKMEVLICKGIQMCIYVRDPTKEFLRKFLGKFTVVVYIMYVLYETAGTPTLYVRMYMLLLLLLRL